MALLEERLEARALEIGFDLIGFAPATPADGFERLSTWLEQGYAGSMGYMERHKAARQHPASILPNVRTVIMTALNYRREPEQSTPPGMGRIASYARAPDYHELHKAKLRELLSWLQLEHPECRGRAVVDTAPLLERDFARRAGLGWFGKNTMLLHQRLGSYFFLGALLVDIELVADQPFEKMHCGTCTACLDACPTDAFAGSGWLDARKCISYLTIELRGPMPEELRQGVGNWLFGCDVCQEVCPWNRKAPESHMQEILPAGMDLLSILKMDAQEYKTQFAGTAAERTGYDGLRRNAAIALGNRGTTTDLSTLRQVLLEDLSTTVRDAVLWAIEQIELKLEAGLS
jgi:epoxyqueuosine reductase